MKSVPEIFAETLYHCSIFVRRYSYYTEKRVAMLSCLIFLQKIKKEEIPFDKIRELSMIVFENDLNFGSFKNWLQEIENILDIGTLVIVNKPENQYFLNCSSKFLLLVDNTDSPGLMMHPDLVEEYKNIEEFL